MAKKMKIVIKRWDDKKLGHQSQEIIVKTGQSICNEREHSMCKHDKDEIVLREHAITSITFYTALNEIVIYTRKRKDA